MIASCPIIGRNRIYIFESFGTDSIELQLISIRDPTFRLDLQTGEVEYQLVTISIFVS